MMMDDDNVDRISDLPDSLIHHILSLLPSTREAVQTTILSKRWQRQWTRVPALIFHSNPAMSYDTFIEFIHNTLSLHGCNKINKFHLTYSCTKKDPDFTAAIRFATRKRVEQLILDSVHQEYVLPTFLFKDATSLLELRTYKCSFMLNGKVDWKCLTTLILVSCRLFDQAMELILSGTPELKIITLDNCVGFEKLVIASNSLKRLLLETCLGVFDLDISCPKLEILYLLGVLNVRNVKLRNLPSLLYAGIAFNPHTDERTYVRIILIIDILQQLQHVKVLLFGNSFMKYVPTVLGGSGQLSAVLNITSMTLLLRNISGIACLVRRSPMLEILAIHETHYDQDYRDFGEKYWSDVTVFSCLAYLKTIKITGFPKEDGQHKVMLNFIEIFLKNARVLEKMVITLEDDGTGFPLKVAQELLSLPRCSPYAIIKLICSK